MGAGTGARVGAGWAASVFTDAAVGTSMGEPDPKRKQHLEEAKATLSALEADLSEAMETADAIATMLKDAQKKRKGDEQE